MKFAQTGSDDIKGAHPQPEPKRSVASSWCQGLQWSKDRSPGGGCCKNLTEVFIMVRKSFINPMIFLWYSIYMYIIYLQVDQVLTSKNVWKSIIFN